ncbi:recombination regulator RecX [Parachitinimonas caeni]|uniref:Regulatory protein RecX n=1 Tax=Parachitinimonas caeni TaxID=3031301 RepID=A0ABT7E3C9_9NEIS|nr:recombination regulator RecX [Parachitinimonas caeni]MDK2126832.1 recombination regulator RecX [Parachitinimonas caeni]
MNHSLRASALRLLARREHSRAELEAKLGAAAPDDVATLLDEFEQNGWLSDSRFAAEWIRSRGSRFGSRRLAEELRQRGVDDETIHTTLADSVDDLETARAVWRKKFGQLPIDAKDRARQYRFMLARGFASSTIRTVLGSDPDHDFEPAD